MKENKYTRSQVHLNTSIHVSYLAKHPKFTDDMYNDFIDYAMDEDDFGKH